MPHDQETTAKVFDNLHNFRDLGGLRTEDGRRVRPGLLFRSDSFHSASAEDVAHVAEALGMGIVLDLRSESELSVDGTSPHMPAHVKHVHMPIPGGPGGAIVGGASPTMLVIRYMEYLDEHGASVVGAIRTLARADGAPAAIHCRIGKDRTGAVVGILLSVLGVRPEEIALDYSKTTPAMQKIIRELSASPQYAANVKRLPPEMYSSDPPTMIAFLDEMQRRFGGSRSWLLANGLDPADLDRLEGAFLEQA